MNEFEQGLPVQEPHPQEMQALLLTGEGLSSMTPERLRMLGEMLGGLGLQATVVSDLEASGPQSEHVATEPNPSVVEKVRLANELISEHPDLVDLFHRGVDAKNVHSVMRWTEEAREMYHTASRQSHEEGQAGGPGSSRENAIITKFSAFAHEAPELALALSETLARSDIAQDRKLAAVVIYELAQKLPERVLPILHGLMMDKDGQVAGTAEETLHMLTESHDLYRYSQVEEMVEDYYKENTLDVPGPTASSA